MKASKSYPMDLIAEQLGAVVELTVEVEFDSDIESDDVAKWGRLANLAVRQLRPADVQAILEVTDITGGSDADHVLIGIGLACEAAMPSQFPDECLSFVAQTVRN